MSDNFQYDVIVVGGGHAGCEAALASARMKKKTLLLTTNVARLGCMPCNPSIGGLAKSHLVFELDALGGEMALNTDLTGLQFRVLNSSRGPAVRANRAQCDKEAYTSRMQAVILTTQNLYCLEDECTGIITKGDIAIGVHTHNNNDIYAKAIVVTTGTAMGGVIFIGAESLSSGGDGRTGCSLLSQSLNNLGFRLKRLKTGTPPRLHVDSIDFTKTEAQESETPTPYFSLYTKLGLYKHSNQETDKKRATWHNSTYDGFVENVNPYKIDNTTTPLHSDKPRWNNLPSATQPVPRGTNPFNPWDLDSHKCIVSQTHTTEETARLVRENLDKSALYGGQIQGTGVRYCPSFEDKIVKFTNQTCHHVILEPESLLSPSVYPNGLSNSLPRDIQEKVVHSVPGLEKAHFLAYGYAIEYDAVDSRDLMPSLESKQYHGLYFAGQTNGTTGYEEAAAQGLIAGVNAALSANDEEPIILSRNESYIGVMIDDLVTKGTDEPYRMFTSRAERRLLLRQDNARLRLLNHAKRLNILDEQILKSTEQLQHEIDNEQLRLSEGGMDRFGKGAWARELMHPDAKYLDAPFANHNLSPDAIEQLEIYYHYYGYLKQEENQVRKLERDASIEIPANIDYFKINALRYESRELLSQIRPVSLSQAARIPGVNPADIAVLSVWIRKNS